MQCYLIGEKLGHSFSAQIHGKLGLYDYDLKPLTKEEFSSFLEKKNFDGLNVTIPYKRDVMEYLESLSPEASLCGAVNTVVNKEGKLYGYNTDFLGLMGLFSHFGIEAKGKKALILGSGGTSLTALRVLESLGAKEIRRVSRGGKDGCITYEEAMALSDTDILLNATPCGMYPDNDCVPVDLSCFPRLSAIVDVVYNPLKTRLVREGEERNIPSFGGLYMLIAQAVYAAQIFTGEESLLSRIPSLYEEIKREKENIVLIGMPGCGKSTIGKALAQKMGRTFVDTDKEIEKRAGMTIPEIFAKFSEADFRRREREVIASLSRETGLVIATGGGAPTFPENVFALRQNGLLLFLDADPDTLVATAHRPLSQTREALFALYEKRYEKYLAAGDKQIKVTRNVEENLENIQKELQ